MWAVEIFAEGPGVWVLRPGVPEDVVSLRKEDPVH